MHHTLRARRFAQVSDATIQFGDLTVLVGPQATGKSVLLQLLKLAVDGGRIAGTLKENGFAWSSREDFCGVYFGEGMSQAWTDKTVVTFDGRRVSVPPGKTQYGPGRLFYIPAHRTLSVAEGWPLGFRSYKPDTPFVVRDFSEQLLQLLTTKRGIEGDVVFPQKRRLKRQFRDLIDQAVFHGGHLKLLSDGPRRQFKLVYPNAEMAYMAWTAGQREFIPLLLGIYYLVPLGQARTAGEIEWVVIEEPEMGLHVKAIQAVMLLILELLDRGYKVAISTHSEAILQVVWAIQELKATDAPPASLWKVFDLESARWDVGRLAERCLDRSYRVFFLDYEGEAVTATDISRLDPGAEREAEKTWGQLSGLSERVNAIVAALNADRE